MTRMRVGVVDIGTNTVRLLVADADTDADGPVLRDVERRSVVVGLGRGMDAAGNLAAEATGRAVAALKVLGEALRRAGADRVRAVATSATREAANRSEFLAMAEDALGVAPEVVSGEDEASLSFRGATWGLPGPGPSLVIDPGGGSTELVLGEAAPVFAVSLGVGSVRLTDAALPDRPPSRGQLAAAQENVRALLRGIHLPAQTARAIGVAGTFTTLAALHLGLDRHDRDRVHGAELSLADLDGLVVRLSSLTVEETAAIPSLEPGRAPVILAGAVIAAEAVRHCGRGIVAVSEADLLEGLALGLLE